MRVPPHLAVPDAICVLCSGVFAVAGLLALAQPGVLRGQTASTSSSAGAPAIPVTVQPFTVAGANAAGGSDTACAAVSHAVIAGVSEGEQGEIVAAIRQEMLAALSRSSPAAVPPGSEGALTFTGCLVRMEAGSKAKRVMGMTMGASYLGANVRVLQRRAGADVVVREFSVEIKGDNPAPPVFGGAIYNAVHNKKVTVQADAPKLADKIVDTYLKPAEPGDTAGPAAAAGSPTPRA